MGQTSITQGDITIATSDTNASTLVLSSDNSDDAGDDWQLKAADGGMFTLGNDIASAGTFVPQLTLTPNATATSSITAISGQLTAMGRVGIGTASPGQVLSVYGNVSNDYVTTIDNDQSSAGHVLKLSTDGNGSGTRILEMEDGDGDIVFRARADGRFGFGPDGVSSMGAGTFVVGIDNSAHTADIAISKRLQHLGDSNTYLDFPSADTFNLVAGGNSLLKYDGNILINNANADVDTKIMADDGNVVLHVDAGTNRVGIGTTSPAEVLDVAGNLKVAGDDARIKIDGDTYSHP